MLTELGQMLFNNWQDVYYIELEKLRKELDDPDYIEGWSIIDNDDYVTGIDDEIGLLIFGYGDGVIDHLREYEKRCGEDEEYVFGYTADDIINIILAEGLVKEN